MRETVAQALKSLYVHMCARGTVVQVLCQTIILFQILIYARGTVVRSCAKYLRPPEP
jgi:hypothetical protein